MLKIFKYQSSNLFKKVKHKVGTHDKETLEAGGYPELGAHSYLLLSAERNFLLKII